MKFLIVVSRFNEMITEAMLKSCLKKFDEASCEVEVIRVPGAVEIPLAVQVGIQKFHPDAVVTLGTIVKGETDHYDAVCRMVETGIMKIMLEKSTPIVFEVLMVDTYKKAEDRIDKGYHAAEVAIEMAELIQTNA